MHAVRRLRCAAPVRVRRKCCILRLRCRQRPPLRPWSGGGYPAMYPHASLCVAVWHRGHRTGTVSAHWANYSALTSWLIGTISRAGRASGRGRVDPEHPPSVTLMRGTHHKAGLMPF
eukprot:6199433-Pleurochrysis_carterae.AAC.1